MTALSAGIIVTTPEQLATIVREQVDAALAERAAPRADEPLLLTCAALCRRLGVSRASVYRWRNAKMPSIRTGDEYRYVLDEVMAWLRRRST